MINGTRRVLLATVTALALGGCNMVVSERPWFAAADALQPGLKDGLWVNLKDAKCRFDSAQAIQDWPDCAQPMLVQGGYYRGPGPGQDDPGQQDCHEDDDDGQNLVFALEKRHGALANRRADLLHPGRAGILLVDPLRLPPSKEQSHQSRSKRRVE